MKCVDFEELISLYIDNKLDEHTKMVVEKHLNECKECKDEYEAIVFNINMCKELPDIPLPEDYEKTLHEKLIAVQTESSTISLDKFKSTESKKRRKGFNWKVYSSIAAVLLLLFISVNVLDTFKLGKSSPQMEMAQDENVKMAPAEGESFGIAGDSARSRGVAPDANIYATEAGEAEEQSMNLARADLDDSAPKEKISGRKVISNAFINLDIEQYDEKFDQIVNLIIAKGGYIEHSDTQYKHYIPEKPEESLKFGNISARVPQDLLMITVNEIKPMGTVTNFGSSGQDITMQYRDTANEIENLKVQEERLRVIMEKAENVKDILEIERELTRVRGTINSLSGNIERWDDLVELSTINISLNEVIPKDKKIQSVSENLWEKAGKGFIRTINNILGFAETMFVALISILPIIFLILLVIIPIVIIVKRAIRRRRE